MEQGQTDLIDSIRQSVEMLELCLINKCNLRCPLCSREEIHTNKNSYLARTKNTEIDFDKLKELIDWFPKLEKVIFIGTVSECTLYSRFIELIEYLKSKNITLRISTNGHTHNDEWWSRLGRLLTKDDIIRFPIEGSTNDLHGKYRVGSTIEDILSHHAALKQSSDAFTIIQTIRFKYNEHDIENVRNLGRDNLFDAHEVPHCWPANGPFAKLAEKEGIGPIDELRRKHRLIEVVSDTLIKEEFPCYEMELLNSLYVSFDGKLLPCNEVEDTYYGATVSTIYDGFYEALSFANSIKDNRHKSQTCGKSCSKTAITNVCSAYPIHQYRYTDTSTSDIPYRLCMMMY